MQKIQEILFVTIQILYLYTENLRDIHQLQKKLQRKDYKKKDHRGYTGVTLKQHVFALKRRTPKNAVLSLSTDGGSTFFTC